METVVYLTSQKNSTLFDWLEEQYVLNKQLREGMDEAAFLNCVKMDLRNVIAEYLIVDIRIMKHQLPEEVLIGLETFHLLSSNSKVILYIPKKWEVQESIELLQKFYIIDDLRPVQSQFEAMQKETVNVEENDDPEEQQIEDDEAAEELSCTEEETELHVQEASQVIKEDEVDNEVEPNVSYQEGQEASNNSVRVDIYEKANQRIKTHEGVPLGKRCVEQQSNRKKPKVVKLGNDIWTCSNVVILVAGTERRTGTTTAAIHLCYCLSKQGAKVCYSEAVMEGHKHLQSIAAEYGFEEEDECYRKDDIRFYLASSYDTEAGFHFIVLDVGAVLERPKWVVSVINNIADEVILITGARGYEQESLQESLEQLAKADRRINIIVNGGTDEEYERVQEEYGDKLLLHRGEYEPELFTSTGVMEEVTAVYQEMNE